MLFKIVLSEFSGESEISSDRLTNFLAVEGASQGIGDAVRDGAVVLVASIIGRHVIVSFLDDGAKEQLHPLRRDAPHIRINHGTGFHFQPSGDLKNGAECAPLAGDSMIRGHNPVQSALPIADKERFEINHGMGDHGWRFIGGAPV